MMQHIAPMQTDIAAKSSSDVGLDIEKQWLGSDSQQEQRFGNGAQFEQALSNERNAQQASAKTKQTEHQSQSESEAVSRQPTETQQSAANESTESTEAAYPIGHNKDTTNSSEASIQKQAEQTVATLSEEGKVIVDEAQSEELNWVAFVEQINLLSGAEPDPANVYDGEIAEQIALPDVSKKALKLNIPQDVIEQINQADPSELDAIAQQLLATLKLAGENQSGTGKPNIDNDLYIQPIELTAVNQETLGNEEAQVLDQQLLSILLNKSASDTKSPASDVAINESSLNAQTVQPATEDSETLLAAKLSEKPLTSIGQDADRPIKPIDLFNPVIIEKPVVDSPEELGPAASIAANPPIATNANVNVNAKNSPLLIDGSDQKALNLLSALSAEQQQQVYDNTLSRLAQVAPEPLTASQQKSFIGALQASVDEYKQQLNQGREPGISLKALITDAMVSSDIPQTDAQMQNVSQLTSTLSQALSLTDSLRTMMGEGRAQTQPVHIDIATTDINNSIESAKNASSQSVLDKPVNILKPDGQNQFAEKIRWMVNARNTFADIRLDPPELGSVKVKVSMTGEAATVNFVVQSQQARDALDQAAPRLRDMLAQQGIELGQSSVEQESQQQQGEEQGGQFADEQTDDGLDEIANEVVEQRATGGTMGGIDFYA